MAKTSITYTDVFKLALPIYGGLLASQAIVVADVFFLGMVDSVQQSAAAYGGLLYTVFFLIGYGFTTGGQILIARRIGEGKLQDVGKLFWNLILVGLIYATLVAIFFSLYTKPLFQFLLHSEDVSTQAAAYMKYRSFGFLGTQISWVFCAYNIGRGSSFAVTVASVVNAIVNIILAWFFIFGEIGFEGIEIQGAALASGIADVCCALTYVIFTLVNKDYVTYKIQQFSMFSRIHLKQLMKVSSPLIIQNSLSITAWFLFFAWIEHTGKANFEISTIIRVIYSVFMMSPIALASSTNSLVSNIIGQKRENEVIPLIYKIIKLSLLFALIVSPLMVLIPDELVDLFTKDPDLIPLARLPLRSIFVALILFSVSNIFFQSVSGTGNTHIALFIEIICIFLYLLFSYYVTYISAQPLWFVWLAEVMYMGSFGVLSAIYMHSGKWKRLHI